MALFFAEPSYSCNIRSASRARLRAGEVVELWNDPKIVEEPPYFERLSNNIPICPSALDLKLRLRSKDVKDRPFFEFEQTDHPLVVEQRVGITQERIEEIAAQMTHGRKQGASDSPPARVAGHIPAQVYRSFGR